jgi:hypothetical protein
VDAWVLGGRGRGGRLLLGVLDGMLVSLEGGGVGGAEKGSKGEQD